MRTKSARLLLLSFLGAVLAVFATGFAFLKNTTTNLPLKWPPGTIPMRIYPQNTTILSDGSTQASSLQAALQDGSRGWNQYLGDVQFSSVVLAVGGAGADGNGLNEVFFSNSPYGKSWDTNTLAVTTAWYSGNQRVEGDTIFNTAYTWDSYRGSLRSAQDIQRVALHEFGHTLGLDHPDDAGQTVVAVMNSHVSGIDSLQADDITGAQQLYGPPGVPANDNFAAAIPIVLTSTTTAWTGFNTNATKEPGEPNHAGNAGGRSVWWKWTAPSNGNVTLTTQGSVFDTTLGVYVGTSVSGLSLIVSNDDVQAGIIQYSSVMFVANAGTTYYFAVDGFNAADGNGADCGAITLNASFTSTGGTTSTTSSIATTSTTIPPTSGGGGGGGGGGAIEGWFSGALVLVWLARCRRKK